MYEQEGGVEDGRVSFIKPLLCQGERLQMRSYQTRAGTGSEKLGYPRHLPFSTTRSCAKGTI
jgi:hypothetical protein